ncbi:hypothetical protein GCM10027405_10200 [Arthrobacter alkaliphilus]
MNSYGNVGPLVPVDPIAGIWLPPGNMWRTEELLAEGLSKRRINEYLSSGSLVKVRTGVLVRGAVWKGLSDAGRERAQLAAYCHQTLRVTADGLTFSHTSAARLHRLYLWRADQLIHVIIPYRAARASHATDVRAHSGLLLPGQRIEIDGLPVTTLDRAVLDCARILNYRQALILLDHGLRRGCNREWLESACADLVGARGVVAFRKALTFANPLSESPGETLTRDAIAKLGFSDPVLQLRAQTPRGAYRFDFAWPHLRAALEFDGKAKYFDYKPTAEVIFEERQREKLLTEQGWRILRIGWKDLFDERGLKVRLLRLLRG